MNGTGLVRSAMRDLTSVIGRHRPSVTFDLLGQHHTYMVAKLLRLSPLQILPRLIFGDLLTRFSSRLYLRYCQTRESGLLCWLMR